MQDHQQPQPQKPTTSSTANGSHPSSSPVSSSYSHEYHHRQQRSSSSSSAYYQEAGGAMVSPHSPEMTRSSNAPTVSSSRPPPSSTYRGGPPLPPGSYDPYGHHHPYHHPPPPSHHDHAYAHSYGHGQPPPPSHYPPSSSSSVRSSREYDYPPAGYGSPPQSRYMSHQHAPPPPPRGHSPTRYATAPTSGYPPEQMRYSSPPPPPPREYGRSRHEGAPPPPAEYGRHPSSTSGASSYGAWHPSDYPPTSQGYYHPQSPPSRHPDNRDYYAQRQQQQQQQQQSQQPQQRHSSPPPTHRAGPSPYELSRSLQHQQQSPHGRPSNAAPVMGGDSPHTWQGHSSHPSLSPNVDPRSMEYARRIDDRGDPIDPEQQTYYQPRSSHPISGGRPRSPTRAPRHVSPPPRSSRYEYPPSASSSAYHPPPQPPSSSGYPEPTSYRSAYPPRSPSPQSSPPVSRKPQPMSIAQLLQRSSREGSPEYKEEERGRQMTSPPSRYRDISPTAASQSQPYQAPQARPRSPFSPPPRSMDSPRGPGQLAERARMLPMPGTIHPSPSSPSVGAQSAHGSEVPSNKTTESRPSATTIDLTDEPVEPRPYSSASNSEPIKETSMPSERAPDSKEGEPVSTVSPLAVPPAAQPRRRQQQQDGEKKRGRGRGAAIQAAATATATAPPGAPGEGPPKVKRGRKPKPKNLPPSDPNASTTATPGTSAPGSQQVTPPSEQVMQEPKQEGTGFAGSIKRRRRSVSLSISDGEANKASGEAYDSDESLLHAPSRPKPALSSDSSEGDGPDYSKHPDLMTYWLDVHQRGQRVQKAYEKQTQRKRRKLHEKFLIKQEKRMAKKAMLENGNEQGADSDHSMIETASTATAPPTKGRGRGRKKLQQTAKSTDPAIKTEQMDDEMVTKETKAEKKKRERREAALQAHAEMTARLNGTQNGGTTSGGEAIIGGDDDQDRLTNRLDEKDDADLDMSIEVGSALLSDVSDSEPLLEEEPVMDEETLTRLQEEEYENQRRAIWDLIAHRQIREMSKIVASSQSSRQQNCKKLALLCQREVRKAALRAVKTTKDIHSRARRANREMLFFWKRNEREEREMRKKAEKEAIERLRIEEEMREARRQARKLNFLITQTELYSHFIGKKIGTAAAEADDATPVRMQPSTDESDLQIVQDPNHKPVDASELDFDEATDEALDAQAKYSAQQALLAAQEKTRAFDKEAEEHREKQANLAVSQSDLDEMNFQNPSSMPVGAEIEQPKMLMCQLKGYQIKGLNWLANLWEQGINGILADEMGLGKTVQSISLMAHLAEAQNIWGPFLVIAPASTLHNWQQEFTKFTPDLKALPYWGNIKDRKTLRKFWNKKQIYNKDAPFHVLITSYQLVVSDEKYFSRVKWQYMVLDEAQAIKSSSSARWKTLLGFNCRNRLLLTGTPIQNSMQELWALLHFIMPSLFDSHEEFSEWFSKDIESHAENKGSLNEHQLKRLHMILKPFMLRRIKKNVQNELGDKIELEISCELTARQRALYRGLKEKLSIAELMEKASSLDDNASVDSLMNLVMQFRKVCNHPELFERADVMSPLAMCTFSQTLSIAREGDELLVPYTTRSAISYTIPKLFYRDGGILREPAERSNAGMDTKYLDHLLNIWEPSHIAQSMEEEDGAFAFARFSDLSAGQASKIFRSNLLERFAIHLETMEQRSRRGWFLDNDRCGDGEADAGDEDDDEGYTPAQSYARFLIAETCSPFARRNQSQFARIEELSRVVDRSELAGYLPMMTSAYRPKAVAPPIEQVCSDRRFLVGQQELLFDQKMRRALLGVSEFEVEDLESLETEPLKELWRINGGQGLLGEPSLSSQGYSSIEVPQMKQLIMDSGKLAVLDKLLVELKRDGHRVLIYFQMTRMIDLIEEYLTYRQYKYLRLDGSSKISDRRDMVTDWQTRPEIFIFLLSTRAGGLGINLTAADTVIFYDSDWNPTVDQQAMDRAHRLGQTRQVTVYRLITKGTIEERILQRAKQKDEIQKVVISGGEFKQNVDFKPREIVSLLLDDDELASKLHEQQLKRKAEEAEAKTKKSSKEGGSGRPSKRAKKDKGGANGEGGGKRSLDDLWAAADEDGTATPGGADGAAVDGEDGEGSNGKRKSKQPRKPKAPRAPKEPKPKKEKPPKEPKPKPLTKKQLAAQAAAAASSGGATPIAATSSSGGSETQSPITTATTTAASTPRAASRLQAEDGGIQEDVDVVMD
ncbi:putative DNA helicase ino80 [Actinomortierella wolfii]|nr:putative DNA helicase ino80 [Actinomortierella wolfii]